MVYYDHVSQPNPLEPISCPLSFVVRRVLCGEGLRTARALLTADCRFRRAVAVSTQQPALSLWAALVRRLPERYARLGSRAELLDDPERSSSRSPDSADDPCLGPGPG